MKAKKLPCPVINQYLASYSEPPKFVRVGCRGLIINDGKILLTYESRLGRYMSPGGGLENTETFEECCERELKEEAGLLVKAVKPFVTINEYWHDTLHINNYFICEIIGNCETSLTDTEIDHGVMPKWVPIDEALKIFGEYDSKTEDCMSMYFREYTIINEYLKTK